MNNIKQFALALTIALTVAPAAHAAVSDVKTMPNGAPTVVAGTIDRVDNARQFVLRDDSGKVKVEIESDQSVVLTNGMHVTVGGTIEHGFFTTNINATSVTPHKSLAEAVKNARAKSAGLAVNGAAASTIAKLPQKGMVKLHGVVVKVENEKEFSLQDATGTVNVDIESKDYIALTPGTQVMVIGYVDSGILAKDINATKVSVVANTKTGTTAGR